MAFDVQDIKSLPQEQQVLTREDSVVFEKYKMINTNC